MIDVPLPRGVMHGRKLICAGVVEDTTGSFQRGNTEGRSAGMRKAEQVYAAATILTCTKLQ